jgi:hypothetical protein
MKKPCQMPKISWTWKLESDGGLGARDATHLDQDQLMKQDPPPHIGHCDATHNDERADHESLSPCFQDEAVRICRFGDLSFGNCRTLLHQRQDRTHLDRWERRERENWGDGRSVSLQCSRHDRQPLESFMVKIRAVATSRTLSVCAGESEERERRGEGCEQLGIV